MAYIWDTMPADELGNVNAAVAAVLASGITADKVRQAVSAYSAAAEVVDGGPKNLYHFERIDKTNTGNLTTEYTDTTSGNNITYTLNDDYTVTVNGTTSDAGTGSYCNMFITDKWLHIEDYCDGKHYLSGAPTGIVLRARANNATDYQVDQTGDTGAVLKSGFTGIIFLQIVVAKGKTIDNAVCKPMICTAADWDVSHTYQPYRPTYAELYARVQALENA